MVEMKFATLRVRKLVETKSTALQVMEVGLKWEFAALRVRDAG